MWRSLAVLQGFVLALKRSSTKAARKSAWRTFVDGHPLGVRVAVQLLATELANTAEFVVTAPVLEILQALVDMVLVRLNTITNLCSALTSKLWRKL